MNYNIGKYQIT